MRSPSLRRRTRRWLSQEWDDLRASLWFVPTLIVLGAASLAIGLIAIDTRYAHDALEAWPLLFGMDADSSRGVLSTIASSMVTVAGVAFSITIVTLSLASSQYTSRVLRNFMSDRSNQAVLGVLLAIFVYCLIVLRVIRGPGPGAFVPSFAVLGGMLLSLVGIGALIYFIHHIARSIQAAHILASVADETTRAIDHLFPEQLAEDAEEVDGLPPPRLTWHPIVAPATGYVRRVDDDGLLELARMHDVIVRMDCAVGDFVVEDGPLARVSGEDAPDESLRRSIADAFKIGWQRTVFQDAGFGIRQAVDVSLRALSPGVNDTTSAVLAIDYLSAILTRLAQRRIPSSLRYEGGQLRLIIQRPEFADYVRLAFDQIRHSAPGNVAVLIRLLHSLEVISGAASAARRADLRLQVDALAEAVERTVPAPADRERLNAQIASLRETLAGTESGRSTVLSP